MRPPLNKKNKGIWYTMYDISTSLEKKEEVWFGVWSKTFETHTKNVTVVQEIILTKKAILGRKKIYGGIKGVY